MLKKLSFLFLLFISSFQSFSQCAMCKSVVESNIEGGSSVGVGLNDGILFLMAMPYLALLIIVFAWIRYNKASKRVIS